MPALVAQVIQDNKVTLVGNSLGGYTSLLTAVKYPEVVNAVVLLNAGVRIVLQQCLHSLSCSCSRTCITAASAAAAAQCVACVGCTEARDAHRGRHIACELLICLVA